MCEAYLNAAESHDNSLSHGVTDHPAFKGFLVCGLMLVLMTAGIIYYFKPKPPSNIPMVTVSKEIVLPENSWYNNSWWSYVSNSPSVRQILQKNEDANGKTPSLETARTFSLAGKMSRAVGACFEERCVDEAERRVAEQQQRLPPEFRWSTPGTI